jgi:hypothetical protein
VADNQVAQLSSGVGIYEITAGLLQSAEPDTGADWDKLWELADVIVGLNTAKYSLRDAGSDVPTNKMLVKWPIEDGPLPDLEVLMGLAELLTQFVEDERRVLVFCGAGSNRAGLVTAMVIRQLTGVTGRKAAAHVRARRPGALINGTFNMYLNALPDLEQELTGIKPEPPQGDEIEGI